MIDKVRKFLGKINICFILGLGIFYALNLNLKLINNPCEDGNIKGFPFIYFIEGDMCLGSSHIETTNPLALLLNITIIISIIGYLFLTIYQLLKDENPSTRTQQTKTP